MEKLEKTGSKGSAKIHEFIEYNHQGKAVVLMSNREDSAPGQVPPAVPAKPAPAARRMGSLRLFGDFETIRNGVLKSGSVG